MQRQQAKEIAEALLDREGHSQGGEKWTIARQVVTRSLEALMPDLPGPWGVIEGTEGDDAERKCWLMLGVAESDFSVPPLFQARFFFTDQDPRPRVAVNYYAPLNWAVSTISDAIRLDGGGAEIVNRRWNLMLDGDRIVVTTDERILTEPNPGNDEAFLRELASVRGREITDVSGSRENLGA